MSNHVITRKNGIYKDDEFIFEQDSDDTFGVCLDVTNTYGEDVVAYFDLTREEAIKLAKGILEQTGHEIDHQDGGFMVYNLENWD